MRPTGAPSRAAGAPAAEITEAFIAVEFRREIAYDPKEKRIRLLDEEARVRLEWAGARKDVTLDGVGAKELLEAIGEAAASQG